MAFDALEMSLVVLEQLAPLEAKLRQKRKSLADEIGRAAESVALKSRAIGAGSRDHGASQTRSNAGSNTFERRFEPVRGGGCPSPALISAG